jgi:hypothetical protein
MAGGEFRLGTASIYMAAIWAHPSEPYKSKELDYMATFRPISSHVVSPFKDLVATARRKLGLK